MQDGDNDCTRIYEQWHEFTKARQAEKLIDLYADDAVLETPLVMAILDHKTEGVLRGRKEIKHFFEEGLRRRPDDLLRWYRTGLFLTNGKLVTWEYPRQTPDGNQIDLVEVMEVQDGKIRHHRIYWGWFGFQYMLGDALSKAAQRQGGATLAGGHA
jgi:predicted SnoaL-like aldol condensation-catalyzing enzyme